MTPIKDNNDKPEWMSQHELADNKQFESLNLKLTEMRLNDEAWRKEIKDMLTPVVETYVTVMRLGKWGKVALGILLLLLSIAVAAKNLLK